MRAYLDLLEDALTNGVPKDTRAGPTLALFSRLFYFGLGGGQIPLLTTKRVSFHNVVTELLWMIAGRTDLAFLKERGVNIWNHWEKDDGTIGPGYGWQWRHWPNVRAESREPFLDGFAVQRDEIDQLRTAVETLKTNPNDRRIIVSAWNPAALDEMALPPCHLLYQFVVLGDRLNCQVYQRSADIFIGVPYNIAAYAILTRMVAHCTGLKPGAVSILFADAHLYADHIFTARTQLARSPHDLPTLRFSDHAPTDLFALGAEHLILQGYDPDPPIRAAVAP